MAGGPPVACRNCEAHVERAYCPVCGQGVAEARAGFGVLLRDFFEGYLGYDSALRRTLLPLLFRPGRLTRDYLDGKRKRFFSPLRFYIFCSILMFLFLDLDPVDLALSAGADVTRPSPVAGTPAEEVTFEFDAFPADSWLGRMLNGPLRTQAERLDSMPREVAALIVLQRVVDAVPKALFLMLPLVALILKLLLLGTRSLYFDHFILTLHVQSFTFLLVTALSLTMSLSTALMVILAVLPLYWLVALKTTYAIGWPRAILTLPFLTTLSSLAAGAVGAGLVVYAALTA